MQPSQTSKRKFHALHDKAYRKDVLMEAWKRVKSNGGAGGIDKITIPDVEANGLERFIQEIQQELREGTYHPKPVIVAFSTTKYGGVVFVKQ